MNLYNIVPVFLLIHVHIYSTPFLAKISYVPLSPFGVNIDDARKYRVMLSTKTHTTSFASQIWFSGRAETYTGEYIVDFIGRVMFASLSKLCAECRVKPTSGGLVGWFYNKLIRQVRWFYSKLIVHIRRLHKIYDDVHETQLRKS